MTAILALRRLKPDFMFKTSLSCKSENLVKTGVGIMSLENSVKMPITELIVIKTK